MTITATFPHADMLKSKVILSRLRDKGHRMTSARTVIVQAVLGSKKPFSFLEMHVTLTKKGFGIDKVTVYRELQFLEKEKLLQGVKFQDGTKRYCLASSGHHHHLICTKCSDVQDMKMDHELDTIKKKIRREKSFNIQSHALEFHGLCSRCG